MKKMSLGGAPYQTGMAEFLYIVKKNDKSSTRYYKYGNLYSHIIGYSYREYGKAGLELAYNNALLNINENAAINEIKKIQFYLVPLEMT